MCILFNFQTVRDLISRSLNYTFSNYLLMIGIQFHSDLSEINRNNSVRNILKKVILSLGLWKGEIKRFLRLKSTINSRGHIDKYIVLYKVMLIKIFRYITFPICLLMIGI